MPRGYRSVILAIIGIATVLGFAAGLFLWLNPKQIPIRSGSAVEAIQASEPAGGSECEPARLERATGPKGLRKRDSCAKAAAEQQDHRSEFILARTNADAAKASAIYAFDQARVAAIGGVLGLVTMLAAIGAAIYAGFAAHHTKRSADIAHDSQRPWIAITCEVEKFIKTTNNVQIYANISFRNTGSIAATGYYSDSSIHIFDNDADVRNNLIPIWATTRAKNAKMNYTMTPNESDTHNQIAMRTLDFTAAPETQFMFKSYCVIIVASAYFRFAGSDAWHATERSFLLMAKRDPDFLLEEWIDDRFPNQIYRADSIATRPIFSGETS